MGFLKDLFKSKAAIEAELRAELAREQAAQLDKETADAIAHAEAASERAANDEKLRMESLVPWYVLTGKPYDLEAPPIEPINERYQWNKAFITHLREQGYTGEYDYVVIGNWERDVEEKKAARLLELVRDQKRASSEPWWEQISDSYNEDTKEISIRMDYNAAFIKLLRSRGYTGRDEGELVDKWLRQVNEVVSGELHGAQY